MEYTNRRITRTPVTGNVRKPRARRKYNPALNLDDHTTATLAFDAGVFAVVSAILVAVALIAA